MCPCFKVNLWILLEVLALHSSWEGHTKPTFLPNVELQICACWPGSKIKEHVSQNTLITIFQFFFLLCPSSPLISPLYIVTSPTGFLSVIQLGEAGRVREKRSGRAVSTWTFSKGFTSKWLREIAKTNWRWNSYLHIPHNSKCFHLITLALSNWVRVGASRGRVITDFDSKSFCMVSHENAHRNI